MRFVRMFPADGSYTQLCEAIAQGDVETAFRAAHTLKGLCLNLGFESLYRVDAALTEELPAGDWLARECFPYGLAALLVADDDKAKFNWAATEYSERLLSHCPAQFTAVQEMI